MKNSNQIKVFLNSFLIPELDKRKINTVAMKEAIAKAEQKWDEIGKQNELLKKKNRPKLIIKIVGLHD